MQFEHQTKHSVKKNETQRVKTIPMHREGGMGIRKSEGYYRKKRRYMQHFRKIEHNQMNEESTGVLAR